MTIYILYFNGINLLFLHFDFDSIQLKFSIYILSFYILQYYYFNIEDNT